MGEVNKRKIHILVFLFFLLIVSLLLSLLKGGVNYPFKALFFPGENERVVLYQIRFVRGMSALLVGGILSLCGLVLQGILRNPLAEPYTLGVSGGGALGTSIAIILGTGIAGRVLGGFGGALLSVTLVILLSARKGFTPSSLILSGVIMSFFFSSLVFLIFSLSRAWELHEVFSWMMGNLSTLSSLHLKIISFLFLPVFFLFFSGKELNTLALGDEKAYSLGINPRRIRLIYFLLTSYLTGLAVSFTGIIGFVGLMIPHLLRLSMGEDYTLLIPASFLGGGSFLILADYLSRILLYPEELPVGIITGVLGSLFFFLIYLRENGRTS